MSSLQSVCINLQLVLNSMHKYQPRIHLVKRPDSGSTKPIVDLEKEPHKTFVFPEAIFTAVTAYQNQLVSFTLFLATVAHSCLSFCPFALFLAPRTLRLSLTRLARNVRPIVRSPPVLRVSPRLDRTGLVPPFRLPRLSFILDNRFCRERATVRRHWRNTSRIRRR